ncbi:type II toxin-antitoxin system HicB family antitoxin [Kiloniella laminariae]|uniref:type II toxin-antitoxin system HicB family antitoxin n=1 Tax=Kiloniella laminariae TaxID=454162 RepID=UPI000362EAD0|nr:type II toxin-antitoxin system HicB family antitoxin [Kiloniella laminariae]
MAENELYPALIDKQKNSDFGVTFPDFPGCVTAGSTAKEALDMAHKALAGHIAFMAEDGDEIPTPSAIEDIAKEDLKDILFISMIEVTMPGRPKRVNVMLDEGLISRIDNASKNRSAFLAEAAREKLARSA